MTHELDKNLESAPLSFEALLSASEAKFRTTPYIIIEVNGLKYTSAVDTRRAVGLTLKELNLLQNESELRRLTPEGVVLTDHQPIAAQLCDAVTKKLLEKFPDFSKTSFIRWGAYSNRGPISKE